MKDVIVETKENVKKPVKKFFKRRPWFNVEVKLIEDVEENKILIPEYQTIGSCGCDLKSAEDTVLQPGEYKMIKTGIAIKLRKGNVAWITPRSGLAKKSGITVLNSPGEIDSDYRGEIGVILINHSKEEFKISKGDRIAQMTFGKCFHGSRVLKVVNEFSPDYNNERGEKGFGSTGITTENIVQSE